MSSKDHIRLVTKYEQIEQLIKNQIKSGRLKPGDRIESEYRLAERLGVHRFTVNKAVSNLVRAGLLYRVQGKGTFVADIQPAERKAVAGVLHGGPTASLFDSPFYGPILQGIHRTEKFNLLFFGMGTYTTVKNGPTLSEDELAQVDGLFALEIFNDEYLERMAQHKPVVLIDYYSDHIGLPGVVLDNIGGGRKATQFLLSLGHREIACIGESPDRTNIDPAWQERRIGWQQVMEDAGCAETDRLFIPIPSRTGQEGRDAALHLLEMEPRPTAAFVVNDNVALFVMKTLQERGVRIPEDFSIITFGDHEINSIIHPSLSTIRFEEAEIGRQAAFLLDDVLSGKPVRRTKAIVPVELAQRQSVAPPSNRGKK